MASGGVLSGSIRMSGKQGFSTDIKPSFACAFDERWPVFDRNAFSLEPTMHSHQIKMGVGSNCICVDRLTVWPMLEEFDYGVCHVAKHNDLNGYKSSGPRWLLRPKRSERIVR